MRMAARRRSCESVLTGAAHSSSGRQQSANFHNSDQHTPASSSVRRRPVNSANLKEERGGSKTKARRHKGTEIDCGLSVPSVSAVFLFLSARVLLLRRV